MNKTLSLSFLFVLASLFFHGCSVNKAKIDDSLKKYFDAKRVEGCFTMLDNKTGEVTVYNMALDTARLLPASTFKIVNSLIALQTGIVTDTGMVLKWDGVTRKNKNWNKDLSLTDAFRFSSVPHFQEIARQIGKDTMQRWVDSIGYGNKNIAGPIDSFWLNNQLKISPDEQLGLVKRLYFDQLPFMQNVQMQVKSMMLQEDNTLYKLSYKTGWGFDEENNNIGWVVGWIEENRHVYFFVTLVKSPDDNVDMEQVRMAITKDILKDFGFLEGKM